jgi:hypothetical protein
MHPIRSPATFASRDRVADGKLDPQLADEMPWEAMPKALKRLENREVAGKVALTISA